MSESTSRTGQAGRTGGQTRPRAVIAVEHQHGARGQAVAKLVADRLSYTCWNRELVAAIAAQVRVAPELIAAVDERSHAPGSDDDREDDAAAGARDRSARTIYGRGLTMVAQSIARRGSAVIVGRGVGFLLDPDDCLRVRVVCPFERRVAGLIDRGQLSPESARATIDYVDRERRAFVRELHGRDIDDPSSFDVVVSTGDLTLEAAADIVVTAYHGRFDLRRWPRSTLHGAAAHPHR
jgi:hypothetical protein